MDNDADTDGFEVVVAVPKVDATSSSSGGKQGKVPVEIPGYSRRAVDRPARPRLERVWRNAGGSGSLRTAAEVVRHPAGQLTTSDAEVVGPIAIPGALLLTELGTERLAPAGDSQKNSERGERPGLWQRSTT